MPMLGANSWGVVQWQDSGFWSRQRGFESLPPRSRLGSADNERRVFPPVGGSSLQQTAESAQYRVSVSSWSDVEADTPELAARAREIFDAHKHKTLATLRRDGSPRISGTEVEFADGEMWFGSMWKAVKALDLQRDPRFALHSASGEPPDWTADAKVAGRVEEITDPGRKAAVVGENGPPGPMHLFRAEITELVITGLGDPPDHLVIESWHEGRGVTRRERR
jgi:Pyridoxamine 5'-phosphate oxidase